MANEPGHRPTVNHRTRDGLRRWWAECACGWRAAWQLKTDAKTSAAQHIEVNT